MIVFELSYMANTLSLVIWLTNFTSSLILVQKTKTEGHKPRDAYTFAGAGRRFGNKRLSARGKCSTEEYTSCSDRRIHSLSIDNGEAKSVN
jgi:hypothetical protein